MKYLSDYTNDAMSAAYDRAGAFFAFSDAQFNEQADPNRKREDYRHVFGGMICPRENVESLMTELDDVVQQGMKRDMKENGKRGIITRELANHEAYYTGDISDTVAKLEGYGITREEIAAVYKEELPKQDI